MKRAILDRAILLLLHNAALRRVEVTGLVIPRDVDLDGDEPAVMPRRKSNTERTPVLIAARPRSR